MISEKELEEAIFATRRILSDNYSDILKLVNKVSNFDESERPIDRDTTYSLLIGNIERQRRLEYMLLILETVRDFETGSTFAKMMRKKIMRR